MDRLPADFANLAPDEQRRLRTAFRQASELGYRYSCPIIIGPRHDMQAPINSASGTIVRRGSGYAFITADHVVASFQERAKTEQDLVAYLTNPTGPHPFDPRERILYRDGGADVAVLHLEPKEALGPGALVYDRLPTNAQEPPAPSPGEFVVAAGFPKYFRELVGRRDLQFNSYVVGTTVSSVYHDRFTSTFSREHWISDREGALGIDLLDLGGMSGGPVLRTSGLAFVLVGVVSQHHPELDHMVCGRIDNVPISVWNAA